MKATLRRSMGDREIIRRIKSGEPEAFSILVKKYHRSLLSFIYRLVGDERIVEDIGQEIFLDAYKSLRDFDIGRGTPFSAWLFTLARNRCIGELRKRNGAASLPVDDLVDFDAEQKSAEELLVEHEQRLMMASSIERLAEPFRGPLVLSLQGCSLKEIADACGLSPGTVKSRLGRARQKLRLLVKVYSGGKGYGEV
jgi:RNA polymerase sigma-70 factor (ECF subfamily)